MVLASTVHTIDRIDTRIPERSAVVSSSMDHPLPTSLPGTPSQPARLATYRRPLRADQRQVAVTPNGIGHGDLARYSGRAAALSASTAAVQAGGRTVRQDRREKKRA